MTCDKVMPEVGGGAEEDKGIQSNTKKDQTTAALLDLASCCMLEAKASNVEGGGRTG